MNRRSCILTGLGLILLFLVAVGVRYGVLRANYRAQGGTLPFTLESALQFRTAERVAAGDPLPVWDPDVQYPEGIPVFQTDTVLPEYVYGRLARLLPSSWPLEGRIRGITLVWFCLGVPLLAVWVGVWTRSRLAGGVAGLFYAVSLASVIRSTGLELSRENFALPLLLAHLALDAWAATRLVGWRRWLAPLGSALGLGLALAIWDLIQFYVILWTLLLLVRSVTGRLNRPEQALRWWLPAGALILVALVSPYHRAHGLWAAPAMWLLYGSALAWGWQRWRPATPRGRLIAIALLPLALYVAVPHGYGASYGHFMELLAAKLRFLNQKPADPSLLTFHQRIMWVPALHSATWALTRILFPAMLALILLSTVSWRVERRTGARPVDCASVPETRSYFFFLCTSIVAYIFFVRFHVYVALFGAAWLGWWWAWASARGGKWAHGVRWVILLGLCLEAWPALARPGQWGRVNVYYRELEELTTWFKEHADREPVLANFGVSASILAYGDNPIILHPKFENPEIRRRVKAYGQSLFKTDERSFRDWADGYGAQYYVYAIGEFSPVSPALQMRYFVDALNPPDEAAARLFEFRPDEATYFEHIWSNRKYRIFRVVSRADEDRADLLTLQAVRAFAEGRLDRAEELAWAALTLFPAQYRAQEIIHRVTSLREQGFEYEPSPPGPDQ